MSNFNALNPIRKAEIIQRRLFGKIKDYLKSNEDDKNKTISELTAYVDSSFNPYIANLTRHGVKIIIISFTPSP